MYGYSELCINIMSGCKKRRVLREVYCPQGIVDMREVDGKVEYLIKWLHFSHSENTWEPPEHLMSIQASLWAFHRAFHIRKMEDARYKKRKSHICDALIGRIDERKKRGASGATRGLNLNTILEVKRESAKENCGMKDLTPQDYFRLVERIYRLRAKVPTASQDHLINQVLRLYKLFDSTLCFSLKMADGSIMDCLEQDMEQLFPLKMSQYLTLFLPSISAVMREEITEYEDALATLKKKGRIFKQREEPRREDQIAALRNKIDTIRNEPNPKTHLEKGSRKDEIFEQD